MPGTTDKFKERLRKAAEQFSSGVDKASKSVGEKLASNQSVRETAHSMGDRIASAEEYVDSEEGRAKVKQAQMAMRNHPVYFLADEAMLGMENAAVQHLKRPMERALNVVVPTKREAPVFIRTDPATGEEVPVDEGEL